ncbi:MAG: 16S rRNA (cytosine(967)-C(5))-methyltransferase RsmB [Acidobacteriota bacterium]
MIGPARQAAHAILRAIHSRPLDVATALERERGRLLDERDRALATEIVLGTLRWQAALDHLIAWAGHRTVDRFDSDVLDVLRAGAYQLLHLHRVPDAAVVNDAVSLTKAIGRRSAAGAVNAVLRTLARNRHRLPLPGPGDGLEYLAVTLSHPRWLVERWVRRMGFDRTLAWATFNNSTPPVTLRANRLCTTRERLADALAAAGIHTEPTRYAPDGLVVRSGLAGLAAALAPGAFVVQDEGSQIVAAYVAAAPGTRVLDACAAPGSKATQFAADMGNAGLLVAADLRPRRVRTLRTALHRAGALTSVVRLDLEAGVPFGPVFDSVVVDAPCSSLGTIRRDPDVRWRRREGDLPSYAERQLRMLRVAAGAVRPGGVLVYSTCSSEPEENGAIVDMFLGVSPAFDLDDPRRTRFGVPASVHACLDERGCLQTEPDRHAVEPFFAARLRRRGTATAVM